MAEETQVIVQYRGKGPLTVNHGTWYPDETHTVTPAQHAALCAEHGADMFAVQGTRGMTIELDAVEVPDVVVEMPKRGRR